MAHKKRILKRLEKYIVMNTTLNEKIRKVYELVQRGATDGEKQAAQRALDKLLKKYNLELNHIASVPKQMYWFKYSREIDRLLFARLIRHFVCGDKEKLKLFMSATNNAKRINALGCELVYEDWVTVSCAYEYFRKHMHLQWKILVQPTLDRCRKPKTRKLKSQAFIEPFANRYFIKSGLYKQDELEQVTLSAKRLEQELQLTGMEGGRFNRQLSNGLLLS